VSAGPELVCIVDDDQSVRRGLRRLFKCATAMQIGPVAFFMKPFNDEKFLTAVRDALAQAGKS
jgi:FixJ family two-component response regulator